MSGNSTVAVTLAQKKKRSFTIAILGDSMILDAYEKNNLVGKIQALMPDYSFNMSVHANNAVRIKNIRERFQRALIREHVDGVIIMAGAYVPPFLFISLHTYIFIYFLTFFLICLFVCLFIYYFFFV